MTDNNLLNLVIEQLKLPLIHIARRAELAQLKGEEGYQYINNMADIALRTIDSYLLSILKDEQSNMALEPVSLSSVLQSTAENLNPIAKIYNCDIDLSIDGRFVPIMSEKIRLEAAFTMLGYSLIEAQIADNKMKKRNLVLLSAYRSRQGTAAGIFSPQLNITNNSLDYALTNGLPRQTLPEVTQSTGAGIFIANNLLSSISTKLRVAHYHKLNGLAVSLIPSKQLQLIT